MKVIAEYSMDQESNSPILPILPKIHITILLSLD